MIDLKKIVAAAVEQDMVIAEEQVPEGKQKALLTEMGFKDSVLDGNIPDAQEFGDIIYETFRKQRKEKDFDSRGFNRKVVQTYRLMRTVYHSGRAKSGIQAELQKAEEQAVILQKMLEERQKLLHDFQSNPKVAIGEIDKALGKKVVPVTLKSADKRVKRELSPEEHKELEEDFSKSKEFHSWMTKLDEEIKGRMKSVGLKPTGEGEEKSLIHTTPLNITRALQILSKGDKTDPNYTKAHQLVISKLRGLVDEARRAVEKAKSNVEKAKGRLHSIGLKPKTEKVVVPPHINPLGDIEDVKILMETMPIPHEEREISKPHHFDYLYQHSFLNVLLKKLDKLKGGEEESETHYKSDIGEDVMPAIKDALLKLYRLKEKLSRQLLESYNIFTDMDMKELALSIIPEHVYDKYKDYLAGMKKKLSPEDYSKLTNYSIESKGFVTDDKDLPDTLKADRAKLQKFYTGLIELLKRNQKRFDDHWHKIIQRVEPLKHDYAEFKKLYNVISKEEYWKTWLKGGTPGWMKKKGYELLTADTKYKDTEAMYEKVIKSLKTLKDFVADAAFLKAKNVKDFAQALRDEEGLDEKINKLGDLLTKANTAIVDYHEGVEKFVHKMISGDILKVEKEAMLAPVVVYRLRRMAYKLFLAEEEKKETPPPLPPKDLTKEEFRSEYPVHIPLQTKKLLKQRTPGSASPMGKWMDYFVKSFPIEEILNEWFVNLGGKKTLDPSKLGKMKDMISDRIIGEVRKKFDKDKMKKAKDGAEDELSNLMNRIKHLGNQIHEIGKWANASFDKYDRALEEAKKGDAAFRKEIQDSVEGRKKLQKEFEDAPAEQVTSAYVKKLNGELNKLHTNAMKALRQLDEAENPFTGKIEPIGKLEQKVSKVWNVYNDRVTKNLNEVQDLQDKRILLENEIANLEHWIDAADVPKKFLVRGIRDVLSAIWHSMDEHWMRNVRGFQSRYNLNFEDYLKLKEAFEKETQHPMSSRAIGRIIRELKSNIKFLKDHNKDVPSGYFEALKNLTKKVVPEREVESEPEEKKASNLSIFRVAFDFLNTAAVIPVDEADLILA